MVYITVSNTLQLNKLLPIQDTHKRWDYRTIVRISCTGDQFNTYLVNLQLMSSLNSFVGNPVISHQAERMARLWDLVTSLVFKLLHPKLWNTHGIQKKYYQEIARKILFVTKQTKFWTKTNLSYILYVCKSYL